MPLHSYQLTFEPNPYWTEFHSQGPEIQRCYEDVVRKHVVDKHLQFETQTTKAVWSVDEQQWVVGIFNLVTNEKQTINANFFISAADRLNDGVLPKVEGLEKLTGYIRQPTNWDRDYDYTNKKVTVI